MSSTAEKNIEDATKALKKAEKHLAKALKCLGEDKSPDGKTLRGQCAPFEPQGPKEYFLTMPRGNFKDARKVAEELNEAIRMETGAKSEEEIKEEKRLEFENIISSNLRSIDFHSSGSEMKLGKLLLHEMEMATYIKTGCIGIVAIFVIDMVRWAMTLF